MGEPCLMLASQAGSVAPASERSLTGTCPPPPPKGANLQKMSTEWRCPATSATRGSRPSRSLGLGFCVPGSLRSGRSGALGASPPPATHPSVDRWENGGRGRERECMGPMGEQTCAQLC